MSSMHDNNNLLVISTYPPNNSLHGNKFSAVASYTKNTINHMKEKGEFECTVLADILEKKELYTEDNINVIRCWKRNSLFLYINLFIYFLKNSKYKNVLMEFEFGMFGGSKLMIVFLPFFILIMRLFNKKVFTVSHGVILDASELGEQLGYNDQSYKARFFNLGLKWIYSLITIFSTKVIVFEQYLKNKLVKSVGHSHKIIVIPHGVETISSNVTKKEARQKLNLGQNDFILMYFGFVIWYKGADWLVSTFDKLIKSAKIQNNINLLLAGGFSNTHKNNPVYKKYMDSVNKDIKDAPNIKMTGFLSETDISLYFLASDLVILPYRVLISASGPFSFVLSHHKPVILSDILKGYKESPDFANLMETNGLSDNMMFFEMNQDGLGDMLIELTKSPKHISKLEDFTRELGKSRSWKIVGSKYYEVIFENEK